MKWKKTYFKLLITKLIIKKVLHCHKHTSTLLHNVVTSTSIHECSDDVTYERDQESSGRGRTQTAEQLSSNSAALGFPAVLQPAV